MLRCLLVVSFVVVATATSAQAQAPASAQAKGPPERRLGRKPPPGIEVPENIRKELTEQLVPLRRELDELARSKDPKVLNLLPDVEIFHKAVHDALKYDEFF